MRLRMGTNSISQSASNTTQIAYNRSLSYMDSVLRLRSQPSKVTPLHALGVPCSEMESSLSTLTYFVRVAAVPCRESSRVRDGCLDLAVLGWVMKFQKMAVRNHRLLDFD
ncbi:hypothetical protein ACLOJK_024130, partial [Asimina triloba]